MLEYEWQNHAADGSMFSATENALESCEELSNGEFTKCTYRLGGKKGETTAAWMGHPTGFGNMAGDISTGIEEDA